MSKNIVLIGLMGSGKTSVGKLLAKKLGKKFVDTDEIIELETGKTINQIFAHDGEPFFRKTESEIIQKISQNQDQVISTGGGCVENPVNIDNLKKAGIVFYLKATPEELFDRIKNENTRPLLKTDNPLLILEKLLHKREKFYAQADVIIDTVNKKPDEIVDEIMEKVTNYGS
jgi:shikimate kinase